MNCVICDKHANEEDVLYDGQDWLITKGSYDANILGYLCLAPRRHVEDWSDLTIDETKQIGVLIKTIELAIKQIIDIDRLYTVTISEAVRHLHFHLIPRKKDDSIRGLPLIQQATQQNLNFFKNISEQDYKKFEVEFKRIFAKTQ
ncbi:HIT family protein [Paraliobacillus ryukyuensis]|uniref:HIT family protein n=1 Tax=Paraliobacillus ryukyuensis TaxID=200904 RepID=UPI00117F686C|nr:HIT family protein [Paraliobacillus ryukyuensis]